MGIIASTNLGARQPVPEGMTSGMASQGSRGVPGALWNERMTDIDIVGRQMAENERVLRKEIDLLKQRVNTLTLQVEKDSIALGAVTLDMHNTSRIHVAQQQSLEFKVTEMLHKARLEADSMLHQISEIDTKSQQRKLMRLTKDLKSLGSVQSEFVASTNRELANLQSSHRQAARLLASLNRLGFRFGPLDLIRRISWLVDCVDMINKLEVEDMLGCLPGRMPRTCLQSPTVSVMIEGGGEAEVFLMLDVNATRVVCLHLYVITDAYPVYLEGSKLTILKRSHTFKSHDSRTGPCSKELFPAEETRQRVHGAFLDVECEVRARVSLEPTGSTITFGHTTLGSTTMEDQDGDSIASGGGFSAGGTVSRYRSPSITEDTNEMSRNFVPAGAGAASSTKSKREDQGKEEKEPALEPRLLSRSSLKMLPERRDIPD
jgi:hypothetical protein